MRKWSLYTAVLALAACSMLAVSTEAAAAECRLELKFVASPTAAGIVTSRSAADQMFRYTYPQYFSKQFNLPEGAILPGTDADDFSKVIEKEPAEYVSENPFRGVAKLGSDQYGFVLDSKPPEPEATKSETEGKAVDAVKDGAAPFAPDAEEEDVAKVDNYCRLYFDLNHNGDLTDDKVIEAIASNVYSSGTYVRNSFPRVDLVVNADGTKIDYAFTFSIYARSYSGHSYASASLNAAAYREGEIELDGETKRVALIDFNSNGRFDDEYAIRTDVTTSGGGVYASYGDMLLIVPDVSAPGYGSPYDITGSDYRNFVSGLVNIKGRFYDMTVSAAGDKLSLEPSSAPMGKVTNPNKGFSAIVYGDKGFVKITGDGSKPVALPEGDWKLYSYTINQTDVGDPKAPENDIADSDEGDNGSLVGMLVAAVKKSGHVATAVRVAQPRYTIVSAQGTKDYAAVKVRKGKTAKMPFGPPYKPVVSASYSTGADTVSLGMSLIGVAGESCSNVTINGARPGKPEFTITTADGEEVAAGSFEYG